MKLNIGCGNRRESGWTGIDVQPLPSVDIVHDLNLLPWPIESGSVEAARAIHVVEHVPRVTVTATGTRFPFLEFMNEIWRVLALGAKLDIESPGPGAPFPFWADPTHCNPITPETFEYFDPEQARYVFYRPKPWRIRWLAGTNPGQILHVTLQKIQARD